MPEVVEQECEFPFYSRVANGSKERVAYRSMQGQEGSVPRAISAQHVVTASEVKKCEKESLLRRPVCAKVGAHFLHGQVTAMDVAELSVASDGLCGTANVSKVVPVAPVVALLLEQIQFDASEWELEEVVVLHSCILSRVLGTNHTRATKAVDEVLNGLLDADLFPSPDRECHRIEPRPSKATTFPLQHAISFAYHVNGKVTPVPEDIDESFCRLPTRYAAVTPT
jgi:hypothetical protein